MKDDIQYLKPNVVFEPLVNQWYAWSHLISPATAAMNVTDRHLKIMESYIQAPEIHEQACINPKMRGGPFMDLGGKCADEVSDLKDKTVVEQKALIEFSFAVKKLTKLLKSKATGYSLEPLYAEVPDILKGYVELVYDLNNQPSFRFFEPLLYMSKYYDASAQSLALWLTNNDERPFVLSTPRLKSPDILHLPISFDHPAIDELSKMKRHPASKQRVQEMLEIAPQHRDLFDTFFTNTPPGLYERYSGNSIRMRYFGHACILIETKDVSFLLDPVMSYYGFPHEVDRFSDMDLPDVIDYVMITHNHQDHILFETLLPLRHKIKNLVIPKTYGGALQDPDLKLMFKYLGFENIIELGEMETIVKKDCTITGIPFIGEHSDLNIHCKICYHLKVDEFSMLFMADSNNIEPRLYQHVQRQIGDVDVLFLGMECEGAPLSWLYGPLLTDPIARDKDGSRRLSGSDFERGRRLVDAFNVCEVYVYAMGQEPWIEFISSIKYTKESHPIVQSDQLVDYCRSKGMIAERLYGEKEILYQKAKALI